MLRNRVIPTLLLKGKGLVKTTKFKNPVYIGDPINAVRIFNVKEVDELILLDITATIERREPNFEKIREIVSEAFMPIGYGGGIKTLDEIEKLFRVGIEKVIINSALFSNPEVAKDAAKTFGNQSIVLAIDVKKDFWGNYKLFSNSGKNKQNILIADHIKKNIDNGCGEIFLNNIDRDGTMIGYDVELIERYSRIIDVPLIVAGGAGNLHHFAEAIKAGADAIAAGSMFVFQGIHRAVLLNYPKYSDLEKIINEVL
ncbi:MAG: imidazole glycerol phosphate synthase subunit HisF [Ignavibacteriota bacterium]|jgi:cyclase|nr:imidazole glycerol phosphate synthase subunit HisF [Ignavibacteriota bacterium]QKJ98994.1 MAG: imidazole glycerol phosphate synthase subunit HisF [Ignavibacteriota bacterium]